MEDGLRRRREIPDAAMGTARIVLHTTATAMVDGITDTDISMDASVAATAELLGNVTAIKIV